MHVQVWGVNLLGQGHAPRLRTGHAQAHQRPVQSAACKSSTLDDDVRGSQACQKRSLAWPAAVYCSATYASRAPGIYVLANPFQPMKASSIYVADEKTLKTHVFTSHTMFCWYAFYLTTSLQ